MIVMQYVGVIISLLILGRLRKTELANTNTNHSSISNLLRIPLRILFSLG